LLELPRIGAVKLVAGRVTPLLPPRLYLEVPGLVVAQLAARRTCVRINVGCRLAAAHFTHVQLEAGKAVRGSRSASPNHIGVDDQSPRPLIVVPLVASPTSTPPLVAAAKPLHAWVLELIVYAAGVQVVVLVIAL
jgi:hypothetical protein